MTKSDSLASSSDRDIPCPPSTLKSVCVGNLRTSEMLSPPNKPFKIPDKPTESPGNGKIWKHMPKCNKWVTAPAPTPVKTASRALTLGSTGSTLVMDEIAAFHQRQNGKWTPPPFFTSIQPTTAPGTPKILNVTPSPTVLQDLKGGNPKVTTKAGVTDTNSNSDTSQEAKDAIMTPSPSKKKQAEDKVSEMTLSPSKVASPTKLTTTALEDPVLNTDNILTFVNYDGAQMKKKTANSDGSMDNSVESSKQDADSLVTSSKPDADNSDASSKQDAYKSSKQHAEGE